MKSGSLILIISNLIFIASFPGVSPQPVFAVGADQKEESLHPWKRFDDEDKLNSGAQNESESKRMTKARFQRLTLEQIRGLDAGQVNLLNQNILGSLSEEQLAAFHPKALAAMAEDQVALMAGVHSIEKLTQEQMSALRPDQLITFLRGNVQNLNPNQIGKLTVAQIFGLAHDYPNFFNRITPEQINKLNSEQILALVNRGKGGWNFQSWDQFWALDPLAIAALWTGKLDIIPPNYIEELTPRQFQAVLIANEEKISELSTEQIQAIKPIQFSSLNNCCILMLLNLTVDQINILTPTQIASISPIVLSNLNLKQIEALTPTQVAAIDPNVFLNFSVAQIAVLTPSQVAEINPIVLSKFSNEQKLAMAPEAKIIMDQKISNLVLSFAPDSPFLNIYYDYFK